MPDLEKLKTATPELRVDPPEESAVSDGSEGKDGFGPNPDSDGDNIRTIPNASVGTDSRGSGQLIAGAHSIWHGMAPAACDNKWEDMPGDEHVRWCRVCRANIYKLGSFDEEQLKAVINQHEREAMAQPKKMYRRADGTVMVVRGRCKSIVDVLAACAVTTAIAMVVTPVLMKVFSLDFEIGALSISQFYSTVIALLAVPLMATRDLKKGGLSWFATSVYFMCTGAVGSAILAIGKYALTPDQMLLLMITAALLFIFGIFSMVIAIATTAVQIHLKSRSNPASTTSVAMLHKLSEATRSTSTAPATAPDNLAIAPGVGQTAAGRESTSAAAKTNQTQKDSPELIPLKRFQTATPLQKGFLAVFTGMVLLALYAVWDWKWSFDYFALSMPPVEKERLGDGVNRSKPYMQTLTDLLHSSVGDRADLVRILIGQEQFRTKKLAEANETFSENIRNLEGTNRNNQVLILSRLRLIDVLIAEGQYEAAEEQCKTALRELEPPNTMSGGIRMCLGYYHSLSLQSDFASQAKRDVLVARARNEIAQNHHGLAEMQFIQACKLFPDERFNHNTIFIHGIVPYVGFLKDQERYSDASHVLRDYEEQCRLHLSASERLSAEGAIADLYTEIGDPRAERALLEQIAAADLSNRDRLEARIRLARFLDKGRRTKEAEVTFDRAMMIADEQMQHQKANPGEARPTYRDGQFLKAHQYYGDFLMAHNKLDKARMMYERALEDDYIYDSDNNTFDKSWLVKLNLAQCYYKQGKIDDALRMLEQAEKRVQRANLSDPAKYRLCRIGREISKAGGKLDADVYTSQMHELERSDPDISKKSEDEFYY